MTGGEPRWLSSIGHGAAALLAGQGLLASVLLASALAVVAVGVYLPRPAARATVALAVGLAAVIWVVGQALGGVLTGLGTDPGTGLLLMLLAVAYWPTAALSTPADVTSSPAEPTSTPAEPTSTPADQERGRGWPDRFGSRAASPR